MSEIPLYSILSTERNLYCYQQGRHIHIPTEAVSKFRGALLMRNTPLVGPYSIPMLGTYGDDRAAFCFMSGVPLYAPPWRLWQGRPQASPCIAKLRSSPEKLEYRGYSKLRTHTALGP